MMALGYYLLANSIALLLIISIVWWFWLYHSKKMVRANHEVIDIVVENGVYLPNAIQAKLGHPVTLRFLRKDENPCAAVVMFPDFNKSIELTVDHPIEITVTPEKTGEFEFTCQMAMYRGRLIVKY